MTAQPAKCPNWSGHTAVILASGPSFRASDAALVHTTNNARTIAVNSTTFAHLFADVTYSGDLLWWKVNRRDLAARPRSSLWTADRASAERWGISWVKGVNRPGLGREGTINTNGNSGAQAINLAFLFGARRIVLLGMDMKLGPKGEKHHHPDHPSPCVQEQLFGEWIHKMRPLADDLKAAGCEVINCTPGSALPWFPMAKLEDVLR